MAISNATSIYTCLTDVTAVSKSSEGDPALPHRSRQGLGQGFATKSKSCQDGPPAAGCLGAGSPAVIGRELRLAWNDASFESGPFRAAPVEVCVARLESGA